MNTPIPGHKNDAAESAQADSADSPPDWSGIGEQIRCPLCEYDLRGLTQPQCPECGYVFHWNEILDRTRRRHDYLFEHHPEKNIKSFIRTVLGGLLPWKFWKSLHPTQRPDLRRLWRYRSIVVLITWLPFAAAVVSSIPMLVNRGRTSNGLLGESLYRSISWFTRGKPNFFTVLLEMIYGTSVAKYIVLMTFVLLSMPALTALPLSVFQSTMRQAKIEPHHVQRCIIYSFDVVVWPAILIFVLVVSMALLSIADLLPAMLDTIFNQAILWCLLLMLPLVWIVMGVRLAFACQDYLRLRHALAVALASQVIVALLLIVLIVFVGQLVTHY